MGEARGRGGGRVAKPEKSDGGEKLPAVHWTLPEPLPITRGELEVLERYLRTAIEEILRM